MRQRFFKAAGLAIIVGLVAAFLFAVPLMGKLYTEETEKRLDTILSLLDGFDISEDADRPYQKLAERADKYLNQDTQDLRITIVDANGQVLGDSKSNPLQMDNHANRPEIKQALLTGKGENIRKSATLGESEVYRAKLHILPDGTKVVYRASLALGSVKQAQLLLWGCAMIGIFAGLAAAFAAVHYATGRLVKPLHQLTTAVRRLAEGTMPVHVENAPDELGELAGAFNRMSDRLLAAHEELRRSGERMESILQGMEDGVVALDANGKIILLTNRARALLGPAPEGAVRLSDCGTNYSYIQKMMGQVIKQGEPIRDTLVLAGSPEKVLKVYAAPVGKNTDGGTLAVLADVTRIKKLENMRREFVANVTHEFKTPLTSICGYVELLKGEQRDRETEQSFYEIIEIEAERLHKLTEELLQLSEIESGISSTEEQCASVYDTVNRITESLRPKAEEKEVKMHTSIPADITVHASPRRLHQLLKNLMENAVMYNRRGGTVTVSAGVERGVAVIRVQDTGIGISSEHLDRIFERFYRVDKGRSRESGGTGLGLSIVKHIVSLYGGDIRVESTPDKGTIFTVWLRIA